VCGLIVSLGGGAVELDSTILNQKIRAERTKMLIFVTLLVAKKLRSWGWQKL
jgi:hypothetical protein